MWVASIRKYKVQLLLLNQFCLPEEGLFFIDHYVTLPILNVTFFMIITIISEKRLLIETRRVITVFTELFVFYYYFVFLLFLRINICFKLKISEFSTTLPRCDNWNDTLSIVRTYIFVIRIYELLTMALSIVRASENVTNNS